MIQQLARADLLEKSKGGHPLSPGIPPVTQKLSGEITTRGVDPLDQDPRGGLYTEVETTFGPP